MLTNTHLYTEIHEQPQVIARLIKEERKTAEQLAAAMQERQITHVVIAARGTSDNAARYAQYLWGSRNQLVVALATPSLFSIYQQPPQFHNALVLGISQSGQSPDIVSVLTEAQKQGALTAALTNFPESPLGQAADFVLKLNAGVEKSVAATKTYTSELAAIALLSACLGQDQAMLSQLEQLPQLIEETLAIDNCMGQVAERYRYMERCVVIGRGYNYGTAFELALKLKELTYTMVEPYSSADFLHGPFALIEHGFPAVVIAPSGTILPEMLDFMQKMRDHHAELIVISDDPAALALARIPLKIPAGIPEWLSPLLTIIPGQLFAMNLAHTRDYNVDQPRGLNKVTETR
ncbi:MAG: SIS domain-containing protein [Anaerolineales bacterium]|nr:SIS domain-containing protein [Anaerolineales bacterium]